MKILVLMPLDEKSTYMATGIYNALPHEIKEKTFCMPAFMQYLVTTKICPNWTYALFDTLLAANRVCDNTEEEQDLIVIGNVDKSHQFDAIFNFQDLEQDEIYKDYFVEKSAEIVKGEETLEKFVNNLYAASDSKMALHNCTATADFLTAYLGTDPHLKAIEKEYYKKLKELKGE